MSIFDWINVGGQVVDLASNIAGLFGEDRKNSTTTNPYSLGLLDFGASDGKIYAGNSGTSDVMLNLCQTQQQGVSISTITRQFRVPPNSGIDITDAISGYQGGGSFSIVPYTAELTDGSNVIGQAISFAIKSIAIGATIAIIGGVKASFGQDPHTGMWTCSIASTGPTLLNGTVSVTDQNGISATANVEFKKPPRDRHNVGDASNGSASFPIGLYLSPTIADLEINLVVPMDSVEVICPPCIAISEIPAFQNLKRA